MCCTLSNFLFFIYKDEDEEWLVENDRCEKMIVLNGEQ